MEETKSSKSYRINGPSALLHLRQARITVDFRTADDFGFRFDFILIYIVRLIEVDYILDWRE